MNSKQYDWFEEFKEVLIFDFEMPDEVADNLDFDDYRGYYQEGLSPKDAAEIAFTERT